METMFSCLRFELPLLCAESCIEAQDARAGKPKRTGMIRHIGDGAASLEDLLECALQQGLDRGQELGIWTGVPRH